MADGRSPPARPQDGLGRTAPKSWRGGLASYRDRRIAAIFFLGISSGLPLALVLGTLSIWMAREGVDKTTVGLFSAVTLPYTLKFVWAPVIDRVRFPLLTYLLGQRRGWTVATQLALMAGIAAMPLERLQSGSSEIRNWIAAGAVVEDLEMHLFDYVPCYCSPAGTGCAMAFAEWV